MNFESRLDFIYFVTFVNVCTYVYTYTCVPDECYFCADSLRLRGCIHLIICLCGGIYGVHCTLYLILHGGIHGLIFLTL